jgi:hypothetical protein
VFMRLFLFFFLFFISAFFLYLCFFVSACLTFTMFFYFLFFSFSTFSCYFFNHQPSQLPTVLPLFQFDSFSEMFCVHFSSLIVLLSDDFFPTWIN